MPYSVWVISQKDNMDEFDTVGLGSVRKQPDLLDKYVDLIN